MSSIYSIGAINQLSDALESAGFTPDDVTKLRQSKDLVKIKEVLYDRAEIKPIENLINCDTDPFVPCGWKIIEHRKGGYLKWDPKKISLHLSENQKNGKFIKGNDLRKELENLPVLNANILDYLFINPYFIPEEWKGKYIFFWGTIFRDSGGGLRVRCLRWSGRRWYWHWSWLDDGWDGGGPAVLLAS
jgi:hypothetical protein